MVSKIPRSRRSFEETLVVGFVGLAIEADNIQLGGLRRRLLRLANFKAAHVLVTDRNNASDRVC